MIIDAHVHCTGEETPEGVLATLDEAGVDVAILLAPFLSGAYTLRDAESLRAGNAYLGKLVRHAPDRLIGFAVVNPSHPGAPDDVEEAVQRHGLRGLKLVPSGWYPYDECAHQVYERAAQLEIPILFHSGIFIDGRSGRFCRPTFYEAVREHPGLRVTLAHVGWPWYDEAIAVALIDMINGVEPDHCQFRCDLSFGPPPIYRKEVFRRALAVLGPELLQFGSDRFLPCSGAHVREMVDTVTELLHELEVPLQDQVRIMGGTAAAWLGLETQTVEQTETKL